jgi:hypothetical protein
LEAIKFVLQHDEDPGVRIQAVDMLVPPNARMPITPAVTQTIQDVMLSSPEDEYVRTRCSQALREAKVTIVY